MQGPINHLASFSGQEDTGEMEQALLQTRIDEMNVYQSSSRARQQNGRSEAGEGIRFELLIWCAK